jgi:predicted lipoprotein with Yx(FWY)xxD motif
MRTTRSTRSVLLIAGVAFAALALAGCSAGSSASSGGSSAPSASASSSSASSASSASSPSSGGAYGTDDEGGDSGGGHGADDGIATAPTSLGTVVVDGKGMTAYFYDQDVKGSGKSTCSGGCAAAWPAIESDTAKPAVSGVTGDVGTITGVDGKLQVTVDGRPIYTYAADAKPGDVTGQGVGGVWYVVNPDGTEQK